MESSKANTVGIAKNSPSLRIRKTLQFFRACSGLLFFPKNGKDGINHPLLPELPYLRTKPKTQVQQGKIQNDTLLQARDPQKPYPIRRYLPIQPIHIRDYPPYYLRPPRLAPAICGRKWLDFVFHLCDLDDDWQVIHEFSVVKCCFCYLNIF